MASTINASTTSTSGLLQTADASGILQLQSNGTTGLTVGSGGVITAANGIIMSGMTLGTATTGEFEYDGGELYFTPLGTQRGLIPNMQYFRLDSNLVGSNATGGQNILGVGCTLSSGVVYAFEALYALSKTAGTTSHTVNLGFGGTATVNNIAYTNTGLFTAAAFTDASVSPDVMTFVQTTTLTAVTTATTTATVRFMTRLSGTVSVANGGTFIPQYSLSAAPGGAYTIQLGSYFLIYPIGNAGSKTSIGTWA
jgi:hypothetical protein